MPIINLIAAPGGLERPLVENLRNAWGGGEVVWLSDAQAAEFGMPATPDNLGHVRAELDLLGIDLNQVPEAGRRKRLLLADMDSTMIEQECIDELADEAGVGAQVAEITARAMNGELNFEEALRDRVALLKDLQADVIGQVLESRITERAGGRTLVATMKANGAYSALVSGGFTAFASSVAASLGFDEARANTLAENSGRLTGEVVPPILGRDAKVSALLELTERHGITPGDAMAIGDGANDLGMLDLAGMGVAVHAKPSVAQACDLRIHHGDLTALLFLQGYAASDFAPG
ncbi:phosphoserine phosphatase SerB [Aestuariibius insulae]|uniref:phosphoserine phosphatase SerB n=1 Tax=Aestuariibius insulae TaxID=2058287 RepID=UPI00345E0784